MLSIETWQILVCYLFMALQFDSFSGKGAYHSENEDYLLRNGYAKGGLRYLCFLADGQGGRPDGGVASRVACESAMACSQTYPWEEFSMASTWDDIFAAADAAVSEKCEGATTLIGIALDDNATSGASCGDSKVYLLDQASQQLLELTDRQQKNPPIGDRCNQAGMFYQNWQQGG